MSGVTGSVTVPRRLCRRTSVDSGEREGKERRFDSPYQQTRGCGPAAAPSNNSVITSCVCHGNLNVTLTSRSASWGISPLMSSEPQRSAFMLRIGNELRNRPRPASYILHLISHLRPASRAAHTSHAAALIKADAHVNSSPDKMKRLYALRRG